MQPKKNCKLSSIHVSNYSVSNVCSLTMYWFYKYTNKYLVMNKNISDTGWKRQTSAAVACR